MSITVTKYSEDSRLPPHLRQMSEFGEKMQAQFGDTGFPDNTAEFLPYMERLAGFVEKSGEASAIPVEGVVTKQFTVPSLNGESTLELYVHVPEKQSPNTPCLYAIHGGGFVMMSAKGLEYHYRYLASLGVVVAAIEYRLLRENTPFPAQLEDCEAGLRWVASNRDLLGIGKIFLHGESAGGNFALTLPLRLKRRQALDLIAGTIAVSPVCGVHLDTASRKEVAQASNKYHNLERGIEMLMKAPPKEPEAWPIYATAEVLKGYPKTLIVTSETDILRDDGITFARMLAEAGNSVVSVTLNGSLHQSCYFGKLDRDNYDQLCDMAVSFAKRN